MTPGLECQGSIRVAVDAEVMAHGGAIGIAEANTVEEREGGPERHDELNQERKNIAKTPS